MKPAATLHRGSPAVIKLLPYALFAFGLVVTWLFWTSARESFDAKESLTFQRRKDQANLVIRRRIEEHVSVLRAIAGALRVETSMNRDGFRKYAETMGIEAHFPGVLGIGYAQKVETSEIEAFERRMRIDGTPNYKVTPEGFDGEQYPIRYLEPLNEANKRAIGYNMFSEPARRQAMARARDTGNPAITAKVVLVQDLGFTDQPGFLIYVPFYSSDPTHASVRERRESILGFAYSPIRADEFFGGVFNGEGTPEIGIDIYTGPKVFAKNRLFHLEPESFAGKPIVHEDAEKIESNGQSFVVRFFAPSYSTSVAGAEFLPWIPVVGIIITFLVAGAVRAQLLSVEESRQQAIEARRQAKRERFLAEAGRVMAGSLNSQKTLDEVATLAIPDFAEWCAVDVPGPGGKLERISIRHVDPDKVAYVKEIAQRYPSDPNQNFGPAHVFRTGEPEFMREIPEEMLTSRAKDDEHRRIIKALGLKSYISVPMNIRGETLGVISFVGTDPTRLYDEDDFRLAQEIAARAAVAVDNARLFEASQREIEVRRRAEDQVRELNTNLEKIVDDRTKELRATNMELEAFCYSVSHDLRTPLRSVDGFSKALLEDFGDQLPEEAKGYLDRVRRANQRMDELITALLTLSRITRAEIVREPAVMSEIAEAALHETVRDIPPARLRVNIHPNMRTMADPRMVRIIYDNLLGNAVKFSSPREIVEIEVGQKDGVFFVRDNGVGFNPEYRAKLFAPFERLHSPREFTGTGVGLATVQRVVHKHGGEIWAESKEGQGATFYFTLG